MLEVIFTFGIYVDQASLSNCEFSEGYAGEEEHIFYKDGDGEINEWELLAEDERETFLQKIIYGTILEAEMGFVD